MAHRTDSIACVASREVRVFTLAVALIVGATSGGCPTTRRQVTNRDRPRPVVVSPVKRPRPLPVKCILPGLNPREVNLTQATLDRMDCRCRKGHGRCCLTLGLFLKDDYWDRFKGLKKERREKLEKDYYRKACRLKSGVGCIDAFVHSAASKCSYCKWAIAQAERECLTGDGYACDSAASALTTGRLLGITDKQKARRLAERGCKLGSSSSCEHIGRHLVKTSAEKLRYFLLACSTGPLGPAMEQQCGDCATDIYQTRFPNVTARDALDRKDYELVTFDALVVMCSVRFEEPYQCGKVSKLCRKPGFKARNKKKWCPMLAKAEARYKAAKKRGTKWPPELVKKGYLVPLCSRAEGKR